MIVSWNWLQDYVKPSCDHQAAAERLMMSGLNLEGIEAHGNDFAIDLEVTSNRPDCLGHIGVARELSVLYQTPLTKPAADIKTISENVADATSITNQAEDHCPQYTTRVIRGVNVGPSPQWLVDRLEALGLRSVNNVVDVTNYVLLECGQPLHAFDLKKLDGSKIIIRTAEKGEKITAIDGRDYELDPEMCVIADASHPVAIAGVMGGKETEVTETTTDLFIEVANFQPLSVRKTARKLSLFSDSSFRFERGVDVTAIDWASRRCCQLIQELAGGEILEGFLETGTFEAKHTAPIHFRFNQVPRILGMDIPVETSRKILQDLGCQESNVTEESAQYIPPTWRADLTREADLLEEVARIYGYDQIPEDVAPPVAANSKSALDRTLERIHELLHGAGFYEAVTLAFVAPESCNAFNPRGLTTPLQVEHSSRKKENGLRSSLIPSLLQSRRANERTGTDNAQLYEIARVFTGWTEKGAIQPLSLGAVSGKSFFELKGVLEQLIQLIDRDSVLTASPAQFEGAVSGQAAQLFINGVAWGWMGVVSEKVQKQHGLKQTVTFAELELQPLMDRLSLTPQAQPLPLYPAVERDFNFILDEEISWEKLSTTMQGSGGELLEEIEFVSEYRGKPIPDGKKTYLARAAFRASDRTLTGEEADAAHQAIVAACESSLKAVLK